MIKTSVHIGFHQALTSSLLSAITSDFDYIESVEVNKAGQCLNLQAAHGGSGELVYVNVTSSNIFAQGDDRVDYSLQIVYLI